MNILDGGDLDESEYRSDVGDLDEPKYRSDAGDISASKKTAARHSGL